MADGQHYHDPFLMKLGVGLMGSLVSMKFIRGPWYERALMCLGGTLLSYYSTQRVTSWLGMADSEGLVGFLMGLFGMSVVSKVYETIQYVDTQKIADFFVNRWTGSSTKERDSASK